MMPGRLASLSALTLIEQTLPRVLDETEGPEGKPNERRSHLVQHRLKPADHW